MATRKGSSGHNSETAKLKQTRIEQLAQIRHVISVIEPRLQKAVAYQEKQLKLLDSVSLGLYDEIDKLSKKAPAEPVTDLVLSQVNEVIGETKELVVDDPYVQRLQKFIPAGDNPQHRDAVIVMRQVRQGLERFRQQLEPSIKKLKLNLMNAKGIEIALQLYLDGHTSVKEDDLEFYDLKVSTEWFFGIPRTNFCFEKLDSVNIAAYFGIVNE